MRTLDSYRTLCTYNDWANDRLVEMLYRAFGEETDLRAATDPRVVALQETATHMIASHAIWRARCQGESPQTFLDPTEYPTPLALRMAFGAERARLWGFLETIETDAALEEIIHTTTLTGEPLQFPLWQILEHMLLHSTYHRGQVTARLIDLGHSDTVVLTDFIVFLR